MRLVESLLRTMNPDRIRVKRINNIIDGSQNKPIKGKTSPLKPPFFRRK